MKILGPNDLGKGILVEWDAGIVNPNDSRNAEVIKESYGQLDHSKPFEFYATYKSLIPQTETVESIPKRFYVGKPMFTKPLSKKDYLFQNLTTPNRL